MVGGKKHKVSAYTLRVKKKLPVQHGVLKKPKRADHTLQVEREGD